MREHRLQRVADFFVALALSWTLLTPSALAASPEKALDMEPVFSLLYDSEQLVFAKAPMEVFAAVT